MEADLSIWLNKHHIKMENPKTPHQDDEQNGAPLRWWRHKNMKTEPEKSVAKWL